MSRGSPVARLYTTIDASYFRLRMISPKAIALHRSSERVRVSLSWHRPGGWEDQVLVVNLRIDHVAVEEHGQEVLLARFLVGAGLSLRPILAE